MIDAFAAAVEQYRQVITTGAVGPVVVSWVLLRGLHVVLQARITRWRPDWRRTPLVGSVRRLRSATIGRVEDAISRVAPALEQERGFRTTLREATTGSAIAQHGLVQACRSLLEDAVSFGVPMVVASAVGWPPLPAVAAGGLVLALGRSRSGGIAVGVTVLWLQVLLWASGQWLVAVALRLVEIAVVVAAQYPLSEDRRAPQLGD